MINAKIALKKSVDIYNAEPLAPLQIKEEKLLAKNKILPDSANDEGVKVVSADQGKKNAWKNF